MKELLITILLIGLLCVEEYRISKLQSKIKQIKWSLSIQPNDSIIVKCVRCGWENERNIIMFSDTIITKR